ncbi:MAG: HEAT repeat domain-containing protein [Myxococcota bacterium]
MLRRTLAFVLVAVAIGLAVPARADAPSKTRVRELLSGIEEIPPRAVWRALGPETLGVLIELYNDASEPGFVRLRAVVVAGHFPNEACRTFLRAVATAPGQSDLFARNAVLALGRGFGVRALEELGSYLRHREPLVRQAAVRSLGEIATPAARSLLEGRMRLERDDVVRESLLRALRR